VRAWWRRLPRAWLSHWRCAGAVVFYALWPWMWHDTADCRREYVRFHHSHEYYNMEFLGPERVLQKDPAAPSSSS